MWDSDLSQPGSSLNINFYYSRHQQLSQENAAKEILAAFKQSDTKKQGFITAQELRQILTSTGEKVTQD